MRKLASIFLILAFMIPAQKAVSVTPKSGSPCQNTNQFFESGKNLLICAQIKNKKIWRKATNTELQNYLKRKNANNQTQKIIDEANNQANKILSDVKLAAEAAKTSPPAQNCTNSVSKLKVGMAYDFGGRGDKSFNDLAASGLSDAINRLCVTSQEVTVTQGTDSERTELLRQLVNSGCNPIIAVGFLYAGPLTKVSKENPNVQFGIVDDQSIAALNVTSIVFAEEQGSYLAGVAAALTSKSGKVGFIGGVRIPLLQKFEAGYVAGIKDTNSSIKIEIKYVTEVPDFSGFNDPAKMRVLARQLFDNGVDVIYSAAGGSGAGNFQAATEVTQLGKKVWTIGVDSDQYQTVSLAEKANMLTSVVKRIDVAVYDVISNAVRGVTVNDPINPKAGIYGRVYGISSNGMALSRSGGFIEKLLPQINSAAEKISNGILKVPTIP